MSQPPDPAVRGREHRLRPARGVVAGPRPAAQASSRTSCASPGEEAQLNAARDGRRRAAAGTACCAASKARTSLRRDRDRRRYASRSTAIDRARLVPKIEWRKGQMNRGTAAAGGRAGAREERRRRTSCSARSRWRSPRRPRSASPTTSTSRVAIDRETGDYESFRRWTVVPDEEHEEPAHQIAITDARRARRRTSSWATSSRSRSSRSTFGRIGAQAAKQVILQKIRDAEREQILNDFLERERQPGDRHGQAHRARQRDRRIRPHRRRDAARPADPEGKPARGRPRARLRDEDRPHGARARSSSCRASRRSSS